MTTSNREDNASDCSSQIEQGIEEEDNSSEQQLDHAAATVHDEDLQNDIPSRTSMHDDDSHGSSTTTSESVDNAVEMPDIVAFPVTSETLRQEA